MTGDLTRLAAADVTGDLTRLAAAAVRLRPDFRPAALLSRTGKSVVIAGDCEQGLAVAKSLTDREAPWVERFAAEIAVYEGFERHPPPVRVPRLIAADARAGVLLTEHVAGRHPLPDGERHSPHPLRAPDLEGMLDALTALGRWRPPAEVITHRPDPLRRLERDRERGVLDAQDQRRLTDLLSTAGAARAPGHGDPLPSNFLFDASGGVTLIDWEHAGRHLPGYDLAVLWSVASATPAARERIEALVADEPEPFRAAFAVSRALVTARELHSHRQAPPSAWRDARLAALRRDREYVRAGF